MPNSLTGSYQVVSTSAAGARGLAASARGRLAGVGLVEAGRGGEPEPAKIEVFDKSGSAIGVIDCKFRPTQVSISKGAEWAPQATAQNNVPVVNFTGGKAATISLDLFFDTTDTGADVRNYTEKLLALTVVRNASQGQPPLCRFVWGKLASFLAYVPSVSITFTMFRPDGTPIRAEAKMELTQYVDEGLFPAQNPTSYSEGRKTWVVVEGQRLDWIAYQEYGDPAHWRHIAQTNHLMNPFELRPGQILKLVPLP